MKKELTNYEIEVNKLSEIENPYSKDCVNRHLWSEGFRIGKQVNHNLFYDPNVTFPKSSECDKNFSDDVFIIDEEGLNGIAYYNFDTKKWGFHTDTLVDYNEKGNETKWLWYYPMFNELIFFNTCRWLKKI